MAARPRKTSERGVKRPTKADLEAAKGLPESLIPVRHTALHGLELPYERLTMRLAWEIEQEGGCPLDALVACYSVFRSICAQAGVPAHTEFGDFHALANEGALKNYMREHTRRCPHTKPTPPTPPIR